MRLIILVFLVLVIPAVGVAQKRTTGEGLPLSYAISFSKAAQKPQTIRLNLVFQNISNQPVAIDKKSVRYQVTYIKHGMKQGGGRRRGTGVGPSIAEVITAHPATDVYKGDFIVLPPKSFYRTTETLYFTRSKDNFIEDGYVYTVSLTYGFFFSEKVNGIDVWRGIVESNSLSFKLSNYKIIPLKKAALD